MQEQSLWKTLGLSLWRKERFYFTAFEADSATAASLGLSLVCLKGILVKAFTGNGRLQEWERIMEMGLDLSEDV